MLYPKVNRLQMMMLPRQAMFSSRFPDEDGDYTVTKKVKKKSVGPVLFDPKKSKYGNERESRNLETQKQRSRPQSGAPSYLADEQKLQDELAKDYELVNPEDLKAEARLAKLKELERSEEFKTKKRESDSKTLAQLAAATAQNKRLQEFDRFNPDFIDAYKLDRDAKKFPVMEQKAQQKEPIEQFIH